MSGKCAPKLKVGRGGGDNYYKSIRQIWVINPSFYIHPAANIHPTK